MIDKFGQVMVYVKNPRAVADFWVNQIGFVLLHEEKLESGVLSVELSPNNTSDTNMVLFDREIVAQMSPEVNLGSPSILFSTYDIKELHDRLKENGVAVGDITEMGTMVTFNFPDIEGNYFAVREISKA